MPDESTSKVVQFFLTNDDELPALYEVHLVKESRRLVCTCPGFKGRDICKHIKFVRSRITSDGVTSHYALRLDEDTPEPVLESVAKMSPQEYRDFISRYGIIEVL